MQLLIELKSIHQFLESLIVVFVYSHLEFQMKKDLYQAEEVHQIKLKLIQKELQFFQNKYLKNERL